MEDWIENDAVKDEKESENGAYAPEIGIIAEDYSISLLNKKRRTSAFMPYNYVEQHAENPKSK